MAVNADWISRYRAADSAFLTALEDLNALRQQYDALDLGNALQEEDFTGANADITKEDVTAAVASVEAITGFVDQGHDSNLYRLKV
jgi:hypothetical protein